ncbi:MAG: hypothetical protein KME57_19655 [Scytonema hyalinum WJT4-NPBG1]|nr:hypothetical protein [Scytonema hyalinum WJT4-NPBG1]
MQLEDYFDFFAPNDIRIKGTRLVGYLTVKGKSLSSLVHLPIILTLLCKILLPVHLASFTFSLKL